MLIAKTASPNAEVHSDSGVYENREPFDGYLPSVISLINGQPIGKQIARKTTSTNISIKLKPRRRVSVPQGKCGASRA